MTETTESLQIPGNWTIHYWMKNGSRQQRVSRIEWKWIYSIPKLMEYNENSSTKQVHSIKYLHENIEDISYNWDNSNLKVLEQKEGIIHKSSRIQK